MRNERLSVRYSTAIYDSEGRLLPKTPLNQIYAIEGLFAHLTGVGRLLELIDEEKLDRMNSSDRALMLESLGSLCTSIGEGGFHVLLQQEWPSLFDTEESTETEQPPTEETNQAANAVAV